MFIDGNKRVGMLFANKIMIDNGCGIITIAQENQSTFFEKPIKFYESGNNTDLKKWIYETSIDGIKLNDNWFCNFSFFFTNFLLYFNWWLVWEEKRK